MKKMAFVGFDHRVDERDLEEQSFNCWFVWKFEEEVVINRVYLEMHFFEGEKFQVWIEVAKQENEWKSLVKGMEVEKNLRISIKKDVVMQHIRVRGLSRMKENLRVNDIWVDYE